jgi:predicted RecA/RadA family phage recombinase
MKNYIQGGNELTLTAPSGGAVSGTAYLIGSVVVVAKVTADEGELFVGSRCGVFSLPALATTPTEGAKAYLIAASNTVTTVATSNTLIGAFVTAKDANNDAEVLLTGQIA